MQPINLSRLAAKLSKLSSVSNHQPDMAKIEHGSENIPSPATIDKQHAAIALLLKQTLENLKSDGLLSINTQKALANAKNNLPEALNQLLIQDRIEQQKLAKLLASQVIKPEPLTQGTLNKWFTGQLIQSIVYQASENNQALLLVSKSGHFSVNSLPVNNDNKALGNDLIKQSQLVSIKTDLDLKMGQQLILSVNKENTSDISFSLKHPPSESNLISQLISKLETKQTPLPQLLASLKDISNHKNQAITVFTPEVIKQVDKIVQQFPQLSQLSSATDIKTALQNSGLFLESKTFNTIIQQIITKQSMATTPTNNSFLLSDLKANLLQLKMLIENNQAIIPKHLSLVEANVYRNMTIDSPISQLDIGHLFALPAKLKHAQVHPPVQTQNLFQLNSHLLIQARLMEQVESSLSRIVVNQLQTRESSEQSFINFEFPFRNNDQSEVLQLKIREERQEKEAQKGHKIWTVNLAFHLQSLGNIRIYITLDDNDLAIQFWTEEKSSQQLFSQYFHLLSERLNNAGFTLSQLVAFHGMPEEAQQEQSKSHFIVDEHV